MRLHAKENKKRELFNALKNKNIIIALSLILAALLFIRFKSFLIFLVVCLISAAVNYFIHVTNFHVHLGHVSFLAVIFSYTLGWQYGLAMVLIAHILAELLAGHADMELFNTGIIYVINVFIAYFLGSVDIVTLGLGLAIFQAISTTALGLFTGAPILEIITEDGVEFIMLIFYYTTLARPLVGLIS